MALSVLKTIKNFLKIRHLEVSLLLFSCKRYLVAKGIHDWERVKHLVPVRWFGKPTIDMFPWWHGPPSAGFPNCHKDV